MDSADQNEIIPFKKYIFFRLLRIKLRKQIWKNKTG